MTSHFAIGHTVRSTPRRRILKMSRTALRARPVVRTRRARYQPWTQKSAGGGSLLRENPASPSIDLSTCRIGARPAQTRPVPTDQPTSDIKRGIYVLPGFAHEKHRFHVSYPTMTALLVTPRRIERSLV